MKTLITALLLSVAATASSAAITFECTTGNFFLTKDGAMNIWDESGEWAGEIAQGTIFDLAEVSESPNLAHQHFDPDTGKLNITTMEVVENEFTTINYRLSLYEGTLHITETTGVDVNVKNFENCAQR